MTVPLQVPLLDAAAARAGDGAAVAAGDSWPALMQRAAGHLARGVVVATGGRGYGLRVALLVGKGNNGGDGWAAARLLRDRHGAQPWVVAPDGLDVRASTEAIANRDAWLARGGRVSAGTAALDAALAWCDVAVDCLLGTGVSGAPRGPAGEAAQALLRAHTGGTVVVACDVPSGVSADDGSAPDGAVRADVTVTFGGIKRGLLLHPGAAHAGQILFGDLGERYPSDAGGADRTPRWSALTPAGAAPRALAVDADKRARGVVLAVAGAVGTGGAAALAAGGALAAGAGLITIATPEPIRSEVAARSDAGIMVRGVPADDQGALSSDVAYVLPQLGLPAGAEASGGGGPVASSTGGVDVVVAGPGLGHGPGAAAVVAHLRARASRLVLDADGINVHRDTPAELADHVGHLVLTPHQRELARMGGGDDGPDAWAHRVERVPRLAAELRATIVAKGPGTMIAAPDGRVWVTPLGGPALGSGGTGDVLSGIIAAAIATADDVPLAVAQAVWWHAAAGELAGRGRADRASATDLLAALPATLDALLTGAATDRPRRATTSTRWGSTAPSMRRPARRPGILPWDSWREGQG